jgi:hypothetical protein
MPCLWASSLLCPSMPYLWADFLFCPSMPYLWTNYWHWPGIRSFWITSSHWLYMPLLYISLNATFLFYYPFSFKSQCNARQPLRFESWIRKNTKIFISIRVGVMTDRNINTAEIFAFLSWDAMLLCRNSTRFRNNVLPSYQGSYYCTANTFTCMFLRNVGRF